MKPLIIIISVLLSFNLIFTQENIFVEVFGDTAIIHHNNVERNCGALYRMDYIINNFTIQIFEVDTGLSAFCICHFDLNITINRLPSGIYTADLFHVDLNEDTSYCGNVTFDIQEGLTNPQKLSDFQSLCYSIVDIKDPNTEEISVFPNIFRNYINIKLKNQVPAIIYIYDISGNEILCQKIAYDNAINTESLTKGFYIYKIITQNKQFSGTIIKQ